MNQLYMEMEYIYNLIKNHFENIVAVFDQYQKEHDIYFKPDKIRFN